MNVDAISASLLSRELDPQYEDQWGNERTRSLARALVVAAAGSALTPVLDLLDNPILGLSALPWRFGSAALCLAGAFALRRTRSPWAQTFLFGLPVLLIMIVTEVLGELSDAHAADRYMMAAAMAVAALLAVPPHRRMSATAIALAATIIYPLVPLVVPVALPLDQNLDLPVFASGIFAISFLAARRNEENRRFAFAKVIGDAGIAAEMQILNAELVILSRTDPLTGLANRRQLQAEMARWWEDQRVRSLGVALIDIDHFKAVNDTAGHAVGDHCLRTIAKSVAGVVRDDIDCVARFGGEEFMAVVPNASEQDVLALGDRLCRAVQDLQLPHPGRAGQAVTVSIGLAWRGLLRDGGGIDAFMREADQSLYHAKNAGRNQVAFLGSSHSGS